MLRIILAALAALVLLTVTLIPDEAYARRGGGGGFRGGGGFHGGGMRAAHVRGGYGVAGGRYGVAGRGYGYRPIPGRPVARAAVRGGVYRNAYYGRRAAYGLAAGAAAAGAYGYYNNYNSGCYYDAYGSYVCPGQYPYYGY